MFKLFIQLSKSGAGNETRTRDPNLGKVVLYQLSYSRMRHIIAHWRFWSSSFRFLNRRMHIYSSFLYPLLSGLFIFCLRCQLSLSIFILNSQYHRYTLSLEIVKISE